MSSVPVPRRWIKRYATATACQAAAVHHRWLTELGAPVPRLHAIAADHLEFEYIPGRQTRPNDLPHVAGILGQLHHNAYATDLSRARLDRPHTTKTGITIPDFPGPRRAALTKLFSDGHAPQSLFAVEQAIEVLESAIDTPACLYKDSNPRNFLISPARTDSRCVLVDFDVLTLAPPGYDLAKLVVTLTMTHGALSATTVNEALANYNAALTSWPSVLVPVSWTALMAWAEIHHLLTSPYFGRGGYHYRWSDHSPR
ncbi:phosphotransferase [Actinomadura sp. SCN-SB]|uniref:phosphotransferase n=1 Tax=Actinomadura sp. SCN-SB TaxID=3373092 RepID=UPI0037514EA7